MLSSPLDTSETRLALSSIMEHEASPGHPYYPPTASLPHYVPNEAPVINIIAIFGSIVAVLVVAAYQLPPANARFVDRFSASWFALCKFR